MESFSTWFESVATAPGHQACRPHPWQQELGEDHSCVNRLIRVPTGLGKTLGVLLAWSYHALHRQDRDWPRRLVWCLPMRTLVDQTAMEANAVISRLGLTDSVDVHRLMGGVDETRWYSEPEHPAILIGTQDMLISRALNRGYAMGRAAWPRAFGMLHSDALWVMDEIQLMGVGLTTSAQIQSFWEDEKYKWHELIKLPRATWWMSATLQPNWLRSPETDKHLRQWEKNLLKVNSTDRVGNLWEVQKPLRIVSQKVTESAAFVIDAHCQHDAHPTFGRQTLVVLNRVKHAKELFTAIEKSLKNTDSPPDVRLIHSRFRPHDRINWSSEFLSKQTLGPDVNRIIIATQVVEAGVDISSSCLITELAPWPSLVQRFGRAARYGGSANVTVIDPTPTDDKQAAPYTLIELHSAREALEQLQGVAVADLETFEDNLRSSDIDFLARLYPFQPLHVLMRSEFDQLFDTSPDLAGADMDVSRFIRDGEDLRDVQVFWRRWDDWRPPPSYQPSCDELCSVEISEARNWVTKVSKDFKNKIWIWDYVDGSWKECRPDSLRPGIVVLAAEEVGGYDPKFGFTGDRPKKGAVELDLTDGANTQQNLSPDLRDRTDSASESDSIYKTIATHSFEASQCAVELAKTLGFKDTWVQLLGLTLRLHDWGKCHAAFSKGTYRVFPQRNDLAKAPCDAWPTPSQMYDPDRHAKENEPRFGKRPGFRHELVSALATLEILREAHPDHPALFNENRHLFHGSSNDTASREAITQDESTNEQASHNFDLQEHPIVKELTSLSADEFNILLFLIASHHGKVRLSLHAAPVDQQFPIDREDWIGNGLPIRGIRNNDPLPSIILTDAKGNDVQMPKLSISLTPAKIGLSEKYGTSWSERMLDLVYYFSPFLLGYLEAIVRAVDARASALPTPDARLINVRLQIDASSSTDDDSSDQDVEIPIDDEMTSENTLSESENENA